MERPKSFLTAILFSTAAVSGVAVLLKVLGYVEKRSLAFLYGTQDELDAYFIALKICLLAFFVLRAFLTPTVLPLLTEAKNRSFGEARNFGISVALVLALLFAVAIPLGIAFANEIVLIYAAGFPPEKQQLTSRLVQQLLPVGLVLAMAHLLQVSLYVQKRFALAAASECIQKVVFIAALFLLVGPLGFPWIGSAYWAGAIGFLVFLMGFHLRHVVAASPRFRFASDLIARLGFLVWPLVLGKVVSEIGQLFQLRYASHLESGAVTALSYGQAIVDLPLLLVPLTLSVILFPHFSEFSSRKEYKRSFDYLSRTVRFLLLLFVPLGISLFLFRTEATAVLFGGGAFNKGSVLLTGSVLAGLAFGLPFFAVEMVMMSYYFSHQRTLPPVLCGMAATGIGIAALPWLASRFGLMGIAFYLTGVRALKVAFLAYGLRFLGHQVPWNGARRFAGRLATVAAVSGLVHWTLLEFVVSRVPFLGNSQPLQVLVLSVVVGAVYVTGIRLFRFAEWEQTVNLVRDLLHRAGVRWEGLGRCS